MIQVATLTEIGGDHSVNEDAFCVQSHRDDPDYWFCCLADGQGGRKGGKPAANLACHTAISGLTGFPLKQMRKATTWLGLFRKVDRAVDEDEPAGFTTFIGLGIGRGRINGVACGDSAALLILGPKVIELTAGQEKNPPVGSGAAKGIFIDVPVAAPWRLLAMTDGVWKYAGWSNAVKLAQTMSGIEIIRELQRLTRMPGNSRFPDDFTVVVLEDDGAKTSAI